MIRQVSLVLVSNARVNILKLPRSGPLKENILTAVPQLEFVWPKEHPDLKGTPLVKERLWPAQ